MNMHENQLKLTPSFRWRAKPKERFRRGLLEFTLVPNSSNNPVKIDENTKILVYCAGGYRSALAAKTLKDLGFKNVYNLGGYSEWIDNGGDIQAHT